MENGATALRVHDNLLESVARCLDATSVRALSELQLSAAAKERLDLLAQKANEGQLTPEVNMTGSLSFETFSRLCG